MIHVLQDIYRIDTVRIEAWRLEQSKLLSGRDICEDAKKLPTVSWDRPRKAKALDLSLDAEDLEVEGSSASSTRAVTPVA